MMDRRGRKTPFGETASARRRSRLLAGSVTIAAHLAAIGALVWLHRAPEARTTRPEPAPLQVSLLPKPPNQPDVQKDGGASPNIAPPQVPQLRAPVITIAATSRHSSDLLSDSQIAGAANAGEGGGGGGGCDMARAVQQALRRDRLVQASMESAQRLGKAVMLWNGDWVQSGGEDGKGLSAVREAVLWEVGFAPKPCREAPMHGLVVLSLADGRTRFAIGAGNWRWSDLLGVPGPAVR